MLSGRGARVGWLGVVTGISAPSTGGFLVMTKSEGQFALAFPLQILATRSPPPVIYAYDQVLHWLRQVSHDGATRPATTHQGPR